MTESEELDLEKLIADTKELAKEKDTLARTFRGFKYYGNPKSTVTIGAEKAQKESEQYEQIAKMFEELKQYRAIGTVFEFRQLKEKATAKISPCPKCGSVRSLGDGFCYDCGTALDWSEGKG